MIVRLAEPGAVAPIDRVIGVFESDQNALASRIVEPLLVTDNVLQNRTGLSEAVYNDVLFGIPAEQTLERHAASGRRPPDLIVYLDVPATELFRRLGVRGHGVTSSEVPGRLDRIATTYRRLIDTRAELLPPVAVLSNDSEDWQPRFEFDLFPRLLAAVRKPPGARDSRHPCTHEGGVDPRSRDSAEAMITGRHVWQWLYYVEPQSKCRIPPAAAVPTFVDHATLGPYAQLVGMCSQRRGVADAEAFVRRAAELVVAVALDAERGDAPRTRESSYVVTRLSAVAADVAAYRLCSALTRRPPADATADEIAHATASQAESRERLGAIGDQLFALLDALRRASIVRELVLLGHPFCSWGPLLARQPEDAAVVELQTAGGPRSVRMPSVSPAGSPRGGRQGPGSE